MKALRIAFAAALFLASAAHASIITYQTNLTGPGESPPNASAGTGFASVVIDTTLNTMFVSASFSGLTGTTTASHIHCCTASPGTGTAGVATQTPTFLNLPLGVTSGSFTQTLDLTLSSSYNVAFITTNGGTVASAEAVLLAQMAAGDTYFNIHTTAFPGGEIRGFLAPAPEPATLLMAGIALIGLAVRRRYYSRT
jgi:CHRD domain/PEP-CTERM motif